MKFTFGKNWLSFSENALNAEKINIARSAFSELTDGIDLKGKNFIDIGFGQGLGLYNSQALGANVLGIDLDPDCKNALESTQKYFPGSSIPKVEIASILNENIQDVLSIKKFDIVHSWGVLHHTGNMALAIKNAIKLVDSKGYFIIAIYNRHWTSPIWTVIKILYRALPGFMQEMALLVFQFLMKFRTDATRDKNDHSTDRGMDLLHDIRDWLGGYPYEYASIEEMETLMKNYGFSIQKVIKTPGWTGCNQFVFKKDT
jgi:SAM-dependent methyltransferase